ncbi:HAD hydrolase-like protein [Nocardia sp. BMG111209]|uniref:HAD hydrolase-like protein n=1 Tax=Nocardia sp. BMG111209 TaxID=1160137 RepID=UPI0003644C05|nr:HAD hydrolase-like protein [Nocardia sp. BMG111209]
MTAQVPESDVLLRAYSHATGGNPLAIRLTIGQLRYSAGGLAEMIDRLHSGADLEVFFDPIFEHAWRIVFSARNAAYLEIMTVLALHPASASPSAVTAALNPAYVRFRDDIAYLADSSLVELVHSKSPRAPRLGLHPLVRAYILSKVRGDIRTLELENSLIEYYLDLIGGPEPPGHSDKLRVLQREYRNILHFAVRSAHTVPASANSRNALRRSIGYSNGLAEFLWHRGYWRDRITLCTNAARAAKLLGDRAELAGQLALIGRMHIRTGDIPLARKYLRWSKRSLPRGAAADTRRETTRLRAHLAFALGDYGTAQSLFEEVLAVAPDSIDSNGKTATLVELGICMYSRGDFEAAIAALTRAEQKNEDENAVQGLAVTLSHLGNAAYEAGDPERSRHCWERGRAMATQVDRPMTEGRCLLGLAKIGVLNRADREAESYASAARRIFERLGVAEATEARSILENLAAENADNSDRLSTVLRHCRAVIFDFEDTIAATAHTRWPVMRDTARKFGVRLNDYKIKKVWGRRLDEMFSELFPDDSIDVEEFQRIYKLSMLETKPVPTVGAIPLVTRLNRLDIPQIIISSGSRDLIEQDLDQLNIRTLFDEIFDQKSSPRPTSPHAGQPAEYFSKPDPEVLDRPLAYLAGRGIHDGIVYLGDSVRDLMTTRSHPLGRTAVTFIAVLSGSEQAANFVANGQPEGLIVPNLSMVRMWLERHDAGGEPRHRTTG